MRKLFFLLFVYLLITIAAFKSNAQANHNALQVDNAPYYDLNGDIKVPVEFASGVPYEIKSLLGETFNIYGKPWYIDTLTKGILIFPNAFIEVIEPNNFVICDAMLKWLDSIDNDSKISYSVDGTGNTKVLKVQWKNLKLRTGQAGNYINVQIWLYEKDGMIEYHYGPSSASNASGYNINTGPSVGLSYSDMNFAAFTEKIWIFGTPPNVSIDSAHTVYFPNISGIPANGTVYRFIPKTSVSVSKQQLVNDAFDIYPSPANDKLTIASKNALKNDITIVMTSMDGKLVKQSTLKPTDKTLLIQTAQLPAGIYRLSINSNDIHQDHTITVSH